MGRRKLVMKKIDNPASRHITYTKRRDGLVKKASELSVLCGIDIGLLMFSPTGKLCSYASHGRVQDIFLRYINQPTELRGRAVENVEYFRHSLIRLKHEDEMLELISKMEALEQQLSELNQKKREKQEKSYYNPDVGTISSVEEADLIEKFLIDAIQNVEELKAKLLDKPVEPTRRQTETVAEAAHAPAPAVDSHEGQLMDIEESVGSNKNRNSTSSSSSDEKQQEETFLPAGPHLSIGYLLTQKNWKL